MDHPKGAGKTDDARLGFDRRVRLEFHGSKISSDGGLLLFQELDEVLGLHDIAGELLRDTRTGQNRLHSLVGLLRQSVFGRLAGYNDVNDADHLALDPVMWQVVGGRAVDAKAASASQMGRLRQRYWLLRKIAARWRTCQDNGSTGFTCASRLNGSHLTWTAQSVPPTVRRKEPLGTGILAACGITRCSSSTNLATWNVVPCAPEMCTVRMDGKRSSPLHGSKTIILAHCDAVWGGRQPSHLTSLKTG